MMSFMRTLMNIDTLCIGMVGSIVYNGIEHLGQNSPEMRAEVHRPSF